MLCTAKTDTLSSELSSFLSVARSIRIGANAELAVFISPAHNSAELACDRRVNSRDNAVVNVTGRAVEREIVALVIGLAGKCELLVLFVHIDGGAAGNAAGTHTARNNGSVRGHTAANGEYTLSSLHTLNVFG